jgi:hypothetical protein
MLRAEEGFRAFSASVFEISGSDILFMKLGYLHVLLRNTEIHFCDLRGNIMFPLEIQIDLGLFHD